MNILIDGTEDKCLQVMDTAVEIFVTWCQKVFSEYKCNEMTKVFGKFINAHWLIDI